MINNKKENQLLNRNSVSAEGKDMLSNERK